MKSQFKTFMSYVSENAIRFSIYMLIYMLIAVPFSYAFHHYLFGKSVTAVTQFTHRSLEYFLQLGAYNIHSFLDRFLMVIVAVLGSLPLTPIYSKFSSAALLLVDYMLSFLEQRKSVPSGDCPPQLVSVPKSAEYLLYLFLNKNQRQSLPGDLEEEFTTVIAPKFGPRGAKLWYWSQVLRSIRPLLTRQLTKLLTFSWLFDRARRWMQGQ